MTINSENKSMEEEKNAATPLTPNTAVDRNQKTDLKISKRRQRQHHHPQTKSTTNHTKHRKQNNKTKEVDHDTHLPYVLSKHHKHPL
ncbi:hypothetical protein QL285_081404 [Trifolium repens]|nr:hypothetical protein QL285_081404 [Trifolium repens]